MSYRIDQHGTVYDLPSGVRIGVVDRARGGMILDEDVDGHDDRMRDA